MMQWSVWLGLGLLLLGLEMFTPTGMYLLIIGLACISVGILAAAGLLLTSQAQMITAAILTIFFILVLRRPFQKLIGRLAKPMSSDIKAQFVVIDGTIAPGEIGKGELSGTNWAVQNVGMVPLVDGSRHSVRRVEGLTLLVGE